MRNKYSAKKVTHDGIRFDSIGEGKLYLYLKSLEELGEIEILDYQCKIYFTDARILYKPDFKIKNISKDRIEFIEFKGMETPVWRIKRRLWKVLQNDWLIVYKQRGSKVYIHEEIKGNCK